MLVIDETGDRKDGTKTAHVAHQYLGSVGRIANGIVSVTSLWADEDVDYPLHRYHAWAKHLELSLGPAAAHEVALGDLLAAHPLA